MTRNVASSWVASSITPIISAMPAGSLTPASPSSVVPERPPISRPPNTENTTAGSVGASAAPTTPASFQSMPSSQCAAPVSTAAVMNVPAIPSAMIGPAAARKRRQPVSMPPLSNTTMSAMTATRSTVRTETSSRSTGHTSDATAAATRKTAGAGTGKWLPSCVARIESENAPATTRTMMAKSVSSDMATRRRPGFPAHRAGPYQPRDPQSRTARSVDPTRWCDSPHAVRICSQAPPPPARSFPGSPGRGAL